MNEKDKVLLVIGLAVVVSLAMTLLSLESSISIGPRHGMRRAMEGFVGIKMFFSTLNIILIGSLLWNYSSIYRDIPNRFTLSLIVFSMALLLYALSSNPIIHLALGFRGTGLGPFAFIPDLFATVAAVVLLYQSYK